MGLGVTGNGQSRGGYQAAIDSRVGTSLPACPDLPRAQGKEQRLVCRDGTHKGQWNSAAELVRGSSLMSGELGESCAAVNRSGQVQVGGAKIQQ